MENTSNTDRKYVGPDGKVAVLVSHGFGAGWYTWNRHEDYGTQILFDPEMVQAVLDKDRTKLKALAEEKYPDAYGGGVENLVVYWLEPGTKFKVDEYDGSESLTVIDNLYLVA